MSVIKRVSIQSPTGQADIEVDLGALGNNVIYSDDSTRNIESAFVGTDGTNSGKKGLVPTPSATDAGKFLKSDGTWDTSDSPLYIDSGDYIAINYDLF